MRILRIFEGVTVLAVAALCVWAWGAISDGITSYKSIQPQIEHLVTLYRGIEPRLEAIEGSISRIELRQLTAGSGDMINHTDLRRLVIQPTLDAMVPLWGTGVNHEAAANLLVGTVFQESVIGNQTRLKQVGGGPALGIFQIEPDTHQDIWDNYLAFR